VGHYDDLNLTHNTLEIVSPFMKTLDAQACLENSFIIYYSHSH